MHEIISFSFERKIHHAPPKPGLDVWEYLDVVCQQIGFYVGINRVH